MQKMTLNWRDALQTIDMARHTIYSDPEAAKYVWGQGPRHSALGVADEISHRYIYIYIYVSSINVL